MVRSIAPFFLSPIVLMTDECADKLFAKLWCGAVIEGLLVDADSQPLRDLLAKSQIETAETCEFQKIMHDLRQKQRQTSKMQSILKGLNLGGQNVQMFNGANFGTKEYMIIF